MIPAAFLFAVLYRLFHRLKAAKQKTALMDSSDFHEVLAAMAAMVTSAHMINP